MCCGTCIYTHKIKTRREEKLRQKLQTGTLPCTEVLEWQDTKPGVSRGVLELPTACVELSCSGNPRALGTCLCDPQAQSHSLEGAAQRQLVQAERLLCLQELNRLHSCCLSHGEVSGTFQASLWGPVLQSAHRAFSFQYHTVDARQGIG